MAEKIPNFRSELESLLNKYSKENESDTPDFVLAGFLSGCLAAFNGSTVLRDQWNRSEQPKGNLVHERYCAEDDHTLTRCCACDKVTSAETWIQSVLGAFCSRKCFDLATVGEKLHVRPKVEPVDSVALEREISNALFSQNPDNKLLRAGKISKSLFEKITKLLEIRTAQDYFIWGKTFRAFEIVEPSPELPRGICISPENTSKIMALENLNKSGANMTRLEKEALDARGVPKPHEIRQVKLHADHKPNAMELALEQRLMLKEVDAFLDRKLSPAQKEALGWKESPSPLVGDMEQ